MTGDAADTLDVVAGKIKAFLQRADNQRITAAKLLAEARERVEAGEAGDIRWEIWCRKHIERSPRDVRRLLALLRSDDPTAKLAQDRQAARDGMARLRRRTNVSPATAEPPETDNDEDDPLAAAIRAVKGLSTEDRADFDHWYRQTYPEKHEKRDPVAADIESGDELKPSPAVLPDETATLTPRIVGADALRTESARMQPTRAPATGCNSTGGKCRYGTPCAGGCKVRPRPSPETRPAA